MQQRQPAGSQQASQPSIDGQPGSDWQVVDLGESAPRQQAAAPRTGRMPGSACGRGHGGAHPGGGGPQSLCHRAEVAAPCAGVALTGRHLVRGGGCEAPCIIAGASLYALGGAWPQIEAQVQTAACTMAGVLGGCTCNMLLGMRTAVSASVPSELVVSHLFLPGAAALIMAAASGWDPDSGQVLNAHAWWQLQQPRGSRPNTQVSAHERACVPLTMRSHVAAAALGLQAHACSRPQRCCKSPSACQLDASKIWHTLVGHMHARVWPVTAHCNLHSRPASRRHCCLGSRPAGRQLLSLEITESFCRSCPALSRSLTSPAQHACHQVRPARPCTRQQRRQHSPGISSPCFIFSTSSVDSGRLSRPLTLRCPVPKHTPQTRAPRPKHWGHSVNS